MAAKDGAIIKPRRHSLLPPNQLGLFLLPIFQLHEINYLLKPVVRIVCQPLTPEAHKLFGIRY